MLGEGFSAGDTESFEKQVKVRMTVESANFNHTKNLYLCVNVRFVTLIKNKSFCSTLKLCMCVGERVV